MGYPLVVHVLYGGNNLSEIVPGQFLAERLRCLNEVIDLPVISQLHHVVKHIPSSPVSFCKQPINFEIRDLDNARAIQDSECIHLVEEVGELSACIN